MENIQLWKDRTLEHTLEINTILQRNRIVLNQCDKLSTINVFATQNRKHQLFFINMYILKQFLERLSSY